MTYEVSHMKGSDVADQPRSDRPDRSATPRTHRARPRRQHGATPRPRGDHRADGLLGRAAATAIAASLDVCEVHARKWRHRGCHISPWPRSVTPKMVRSPPGVHPAASRRGQSVACATQGQRATAVAVVVFGLFNTDLHVHLTDHSAPAVDRGRDQTLAVPVLDLHHRPELPGQSKRCWTSTHGSGTETVDRQRVRDLRG